MKDVVPPLKPIRKRTKRSLILIANFLDGFAEGWRFAIHDGFREALDIKWTRRVEDKKEIYKWTQGKEFHFPEGYIIYDTAMAYKLNWLDALRKIKLFIQVIDSIPGYTIKFKFYRPNKSFTSVEEIETVECLQKSFVNMLITGNLELFSGEIIDVFKKYSICKFSPSTDQQNIEKEQ